MSLPTIILFFLYTWGLGYSLTRWLQNSENPFERNVMRVGFGLGAFVLLGVLFNLVHIPIDWRWFFLISLVVPVYSIIKAIKNRSFTFTRPKLTKTNIYIAAALLIFLFSFFMYTKGAFSYPYLEDDDPWGHAEGSKYVAVEKTIETHVESLEERFKGVRFFGYLDPYPPGYDMLMGVLNQTAPSLSWTLKFFNALIISLSLLFFFFFMREFTKDNKLSLGAMFILTLIPAYFTHFIWAHTLIVAIFFPVMYILERIKTDKRWSYALSVVFAGMLLVQPSKIFKLVPMMLLYLIIRFAIERKFPRFESIGIVAGAVLSGAWWFEKGVKMLTIKVAARTGSTASELSQSSGLFDLIGKTLTRLPEIFPPSGGSATRAYEFNDFFFAQPQGLINNSVGIGIIIYLLLFAASIYILFNIYAAIRDRKPEVGVWLYPLIIIHALASLVTVVLALRYLSFPASLFSPALSFTSLLSLKIDLAQFLLLSILLLLAHIKKLQQETTSWHVTAYAWLTFTFLFINSETFALPIGLWAFRVWALFAIPTAMLAPEGIRGILNLVNIIAKTLSTKHSSSSAPSDQFKSAALIQYLTLAIILIGIILTSGYQKYSINTSQWPPGGSWTGPEELQAYIWLKDNLPPNTKVFPYSARDQNIIGVDMQSCKWCPEIIEFRKKILDHDAETLHRFLKQQGYEYLIVDAMSVKYHKKYFGYNETFVQEQLPKRINEFAGSGLFKIVHQTRAAVIFEVE